VLQRPGAGEPIHVRIRRAALPNHRSRPKIVPDGSGYQA
jgi:hypothetical protein